MHKEKLYVVLGGLLHDIGKPAYRRLNKRENHSLAGYNFLKDEVGLNEPKILEQVKYHHSRMIRSAGDKLNKSSYAYITYKADNIASGADRRKRSETSWFDRDIPLESVFNIINENNAKLKYKPQTMESGINYPSDKEVAFSKELYNKICSDMSDQLRGIEYTDTYVNSLLEIMEADCSFIPSCTNIGEIPDISLYDHLKITAAVGTCIYDWLSENGIDDYYNALYNSDKSDKFDKEKAFLMCSFDFSGIQSFIYTINAKGTLKMLRSRSFYLELLCEHFIDVILNETEYSRTNLIYSGGGHGYILLANTEKVRATIDRLHREINDWFMENFKTSLYAAVAYTECSANELKNESDGISSDNGAYSDIFIRLSRKLSAEKINRYSASDIIKMNSAPSGGERECRICRRSDTGTENDICEFCSRLMEMSDDIIEKDFIAVMGDNSGLPLPFGCSILFTDRERLTDDFMQSENYVRCYCKNKMHSGKNVASKIWVGDYHTDKEFTKLAEKSKGIERIGILRADVDNLGKAFVSGFDKAHISLTRTAVFSRKLSIFFKKHINEIFKEKGVNALIVYSGGDDLFLVSSWSDAIPAALTLRDAFRKFTGGILTISAGIGIYSPKYPIESMAYESGELETVSKESGRNKITLFSGNNSDRERYTFDWDELRDDVIGEKLKCIKDYFDKQDEHGKNLIYNLLDYLRSVDDRINLARYAYLLARTEPDDDAPELEKVRYREFSRKMYKWALDKEDRQKLIMAIYLYVYETRERDK